MGALSSHFRADSCRQAGRRLFGLVYAVLLGASLPAAALAQGIQRPSAERLLRERLHDTSGGPLKLMVTERPVAAGVLAIYWTGAAPCVDCPPRRVAVAAVGDSLYPLDDLQALARLWVTAGFPSHLAGDELRVACKDLLQGSGFIASGHWPLESERSIAPDVRARFRPARALRQIRRPKDRDAPLGASSVFYVGNSSEVFRIECNLTSGDLSIRLDTVAVSYLAGYPAPTGSQR